MYCLIAIVSILTTRALSNRRDASHDQLIPFEPRHIVCDSVFQRTLSTLRNYSFVLVDSKDCVSKQDVLVFLLTARDQMVKPAFLVATADPAERAGLLRLMHQLGVDQPICWDLDGQIANTLSKHRGPQTVQVQAGAAIVRVNP